MDLLDSIKPGNRKINATNSFHVETNWMDRITIGATKNTRRKMVMGMS